jgi:hypothetical protein
MDDYIVNGLPLPPLLIELIQSNQWQHPGDEILKVLVPCIHEPVDFLSIERMRREAPGVMADFLPNNFPWIHETRGSKQGKPVVLPWLDVEKAVFIAVNKYPGDDVAIALDYRKNIFDPQVIASNWHTSGAGCLWQEITPTFSQFIEQIKLAKSKF